MTTRRTASIALSAIALGVVASGCGIHIGIRDYTKQLAANAQVSTPVTGLNLDTGNGNVKIHSGSGTGVTIQRTVHYDSGHPHPSQSVKDGILTFDDGCNHCSVDYTLTVPAALAVTAHVDSGDVTVDGVASADLKASSGTLTVDNVKGGVTAHVDSGDIKLETVGGALDLSAESGSINGSGLGGKVAKAKTDSGGIRVDFTAIPSSVVAHTSSGSLHVLVPQQTYRITGTSSSGDRKINIPRSDTSAFHLDLSTDAGDVTVDPG